MVLLDPTPEVLEVETMNGAYAEVAPAQPITLPINNHLAPPVPEEVEETGLDFDFLADLVLKAVEFDTHCTTESVSELLKLPRTITALLLQQLCNSKLIQNGGQVVQGNNRYAMLDRGSERVQRLLNANSYVGPAPVSLASYSEMVRWQQSSREPISRESVRAALAHLVLSESTVQTFGLVASSRRSLFISGPPGNGKTSLAKALHSALSGDVWIPYAIEVDGQVIKVFDSHNHEPVSSPSSVPHDKRWIKVRPPLVMVGGELTIETMDLIYSRTVGYYEAPFQVKANGGTLVIDDFGRQRIDPRVLLNRWIIPLEGRVDYLTLHTGKKIEIPFEPLLVFATNLTPDDLVDGAFLRRMGYRLNTDAPTVDTYRLIFEQYAESRGLNHERELLDLLLMRYQEEQRPLSCCDPENLVERCLDICRYENLPLTLTPALLELAWVGYFGSPSWLKASNTSTATALR